MTEEEIKKLIDTAIANGLKTGLDSFQKHYSARLEEVVRPIADRLAELDTEGDDPAPNKPSTESPEVKALQKRLEEMEKRDSARDAELKQSKLSAALAKEVAAKNPLHANVVQELLSTRLAGAIEKDGDYYLPNGRKLGEEVADFFTSPAGSHFLPNPAKVSTDSNPNTTKATSEGKKDGAKPSLDDMLADFVF